MVNAINGLELNRLMEFGLGLASTPYLGVTAADYHLKVASTAIGLTIATIMFVASEVFGELMARLNLPYVLGNLVAGVVLGISALHIIVAPEATDQLSVLLLNVLPLVFRPIFGRLTEG